VVSGATIGSNVRLPGIPTAARIWVKGNNTKDRYRDTDRQDLEEIQRIAGDRLSEQQVKSVILFLTGERTNRAADCKNHQNHWQKEEIELARQVANW
jgi:hypothetical protein